MKYKTNDTKLQYLKRINIVLDHIEKNLDTNFSLDQLSEKAFYSSFHFHRIFSAIVGEPLNSLIHRKRIERIGAILLVGTQEPLKDLAYRYGFNSESSFARAFKKYYGVNASEFKLQGKDVISKIGIELVTPEKYLCSINEIKSWMDMNAQIEVHELQEMKLAGIMHIGALDKVGATFERVFAWAHQKKLLNGNHVKAITLYHDNPRITDKSQVRLSACVTVDKDFVAEGEVRKVMIEKGPYAVGHFEITTEAFPKAWESMCVWVVEHDYGFRDSDYFELYHNDPHTHPEHKSIVDICIPVNESPAQKKNRAAKSRQDKLTYYKGEIEKGFIQKDYDFLISYIKTLRMHFNKEYPTDYKVGSLYQGNMNYTYFPFTPTALKTLKLKVVIIFNHLKTRFEICLAGQNRQIQKKYWHIFKGSDWHVYRIPESVDESFSIVEHLLVEKPDFNDLGKLTASIDAETHKFIKEIMLVLG